jgi:hypothetical protein
MGDVNLYTKLMKMRVELQKEDIKKTGENKFSNFTYYELADFLPQCNRIASNNNALFLYQLEKEQATLTLINCDNLEEKIVFYLPLAELSIKGANGIQNIGGLATYTRRYLYLIAFEISESDEFDPNENNSHKPESHDKSTDEQQKQVDEISKQKIQQPKIHTIQKELLRTGVSADAICTRYKVTDLSEITEGIFPSVMQALKKTPDINKGEQ